MALKIYFLHSKDNDEGQKRRLCREQKKVAINEKKRRIIISSPNQKITDKGHLTKKTLTNIVLILLIFTQCQLN